MNKRYYSIFEILSFILYLTKITNSLKAEESITQFSEERLENFLKNVLEHKGTSNSKSEEESEEKMSKEVSNRIGERELASIELWGTTTSNFFEKEQEENKDFTNYCLDFKPCKYRTDCPNFR